MSKKSAGILLYRFKNSSLEVLLVHPGGPFWKNKDLGAWTIPKGEFTDEEDPLDAAKREFEEETSFPPPEKYIELTPIKQKSGKAVFAWAAEGNIDTEKIQSNEFEMEWPPHSGKKQKFPEVDKGNWFAISDAKKKIIPAQLNFLEELSSLLKEK
jgi:predicted NUDIX family NTP pyrophosphohydrolase